MILLGRPATFSTVNYKPSATGKIHQIAPGPATVKVPIKNFSICIIIQITTESILLVLRIESVKKFTRICPQLFTFPTERQTDGQSENMSIANVSECS